MSDQPKNPLQTKNIEKFIKTEKIEKLEHKEKPEKFEHKEKPEKFEHKEKPEKFEHKEKPEKFEHKEIEKLIKDHPEKLIFETNQPGNPGDPIEQRVAALEQSMAEMNHFITNQQRPDLSRGALANEPASKKT